MAVDHPENYVILMLFRRDLHTWEQEKPIDEIDWSDIRVTRKDIERSDRVDFIDRDGTCRIMKQRKPNAEFPKKAVSVCRPASFEFFNVRESMPYWNGVY